jgi:fermentation-respiration switch protein FrsA (DUF1100 family)
MGCGIEAGGDELCLSALERGQTALSYLDPGPHLSAVRCPVHLVHGRDDDVIPRTEMHRLSEMLSRSTEVRTYLTGLYGHARPEGLRALLGTLPAVTREMATMARMLGALDEVTQRGGLQRRRE